MAMLQLQFFKTLKINFNGLAFILESFANKELECILAKKLRKDLSNYFKNNKGKRKHLKIKAANLIYAFLEKVAALPLRRWSSKL